MTKIDVMEFVEHEEYYPLDPKERKSLLRIVDIMPRLIGDDSESRARKCDSAVIQAARTSYGLGLKSITEDTGLIRYLYRNAHTTPFEMVEFKFHCKMPIFVARQWIRHRTACCGSKTKLHFDLPSGIERRGNQLYTLTIEEVYNRFQPSQNITRPDKQRYQYHKKDRVQEMKLRSLDEETSEIIHTNIVDIWETGIKPVWEVWFNEKIVYCSEDHLFYTNQGWKKLNEVVQLTKSWNNKVNDGVKFSWIGLRLKSKKKCFIPSVDISNEQWVDIPNWEGIYEISTQGRVRRIGCEYCKEQAVSDERLRISLNKPGKQEVWMVHQLVMLAFSGPCPEGMEICHEDGNGFNNHLDNLRYDTTQGNAIDRIEHEATTKLHCNWVIPSIRYVGEEMTYDLEVSGPYHNFSAGGFVVHNSVNEISGRYSVLPDNFYIPETSNVRKQSKVNKQGSDVPVDILDASAFANELEVKCKELYEWYLSKIGDGIGKELARMILPLNIYTEWYWKIDLHNLLNFLKLRCDKHAQWEIRVFADAMLAIVRSVCPITVQAWEDYSDYRGAIKFSRLECEKLKMMLANVDPNYPLGSGNKREDDEFGMKLRKLLID